MLNKLINIFILLNIIIISNSLIINCSNNKAKGPELLVFAPASMSDVLPEVLESFNDPNINVIFDFGGSAILASKISNGAPLGFHEDRWDPSARNAENAKVKIELTDKGGKAID